MEFSTRLKKYTGLGFLLSLLHGFEIIQTGAVAEMSYSYTHFFQNIDQAVYLVQHIGIYVAFFIVFCFMMGRKWIYLPLLFIGYILTVETHHIIRSIITLTYSEGIITSTLFIPLALLYWKELYDSIKDRSVGKKKNV